VGVGTPRYSRFGNLRYAKQIRARRSGKLPKAIGNGPKYFLALDSRCPTPRSIMARMRMKFFPPFKDEGEVVATWGQAQLIKYLDGRLELRGGSAQDHAAALEWMSLFWHEAVVCCFPAKSR
jgi:hypothetical protein